MNPPPSPRQPALDRAQGYLDLGMSREAWDELASLPSAAQDSAEALQLQAALLIQQRRWTEALAVSRRLCAVHPTSSGGYIHAAYCLHELGRTREASDLLRSGPPSLEEEPIYHYNLSCYQTHLGELEDARQRLERSFELDERLAGIAERDPDLRPLWASLRW
jgi:Flp pilus assembly protein TadD